LITRHSLRDRRRPLCILLAEDVASNQQVAAKLLTTRGHVVDVVTNGSEAVEAARRGSYDVVLMDIEMPLMDGITAARLIREERWDDVLEAIETMLLFAPGEVDQWREAGLLHARMDHVEDAVRALEEYMRRCGGDDTRYNTSVLLQELRSRLN